MTSAAGFEIYYLTTDNVTDHLLKFELDDNYLILRNIATAKCVPLQIQTRPTGVALSGNGVLSGVQKLRKLDADSETFFSEAYLSGCYDYYRFMAMAVLTISCFDCSRNLIRTVEHPFNGISISSGYDYYHFMARLCWEDLLPRRVRALCVECFSDQYSFRCPRLLRRL